MLTTNKTYSRYFTPSEFYINTEAAMSYSRMLKRLGMYILLSHILVAPSLFYITQKLIPLLRVLYHTGREKILSFLLAKF
jgi:hypothetical protein